MTALADMVLASDETRERLRTRVDRAIVDLGIRRCSWEPQAGAQQAAFDSLADELLYGGAAGGGKTDLLLGAARHQGRSALILRKTYTRLEESVIARSLKMYGDRHCYNAQRHIWLFPEEEVRIRLGAAPAHDVMAYQGGAYDFIGFDEATEFLASQYMFLVSRNRSVEPSQRCRMIACTNPVGTSVEFFMERWGPWLLEGHPRPAAPGELRWFVMASADLDVEVDGPEPVDVGNFVERALGRNAGQPLSGREFGELQVAIDGMETKQLLPTSRTYIPAKLIDNRYLGDAYRARLMALPEPLRSQLLNGDWAAGQTDDAAQVIPSAWLKAAQSRWVEPTGAPDAIGVDVARGGDDRTVLASRFGNVFGQPTAVPGRETPNGQAVFDLLTPLIVGRMPLVNMDIIGVGSGAFDIAKERSIPRVEGVNVATATDRRDRSGTLSFANLRTALWWQFRESLDPDHNSLVALPPNPSLAAELKSARFDFRANGLVRVRKKDEQKEMLGRSPDLADAVLLASYVPNRVFATSDVMSCASGPYAPPAHAEIIIGVAFSRAEGHRIVFAARDGAKTFVYAEKLVTGGPAELAAGIVCDLGGRTARLSMLSVVDSSERKAVLRECRLAGHSCRSGYDEAAGVMALQSALGGGVMTIAETCPRILDALSLFQLAPESRSAQIAGERGRFGWAGEAGFVRALIDVASFTRMIGETRESKPITPAQKVLKGIQKKRKPKALPW